MNMVDYNWTYSNQDINGFWLDQVANKDGWLFFNQKKDIVDERIKKSGVCQKYIFLNKAIGGSVPLNKE